MKKRKQNCRPREQLLNATQTKHGKCTCKKLTFAGLALFALPWIVSGMFVIRTVSEEVEKRGRLSEKLKYFQFSKKSITEGVWGRIETIPITIQPPTRFFGPEQQHDRTDLWTFPDLSLSSLQEMFETEVINKQVTHLLVRNTRVSADGRNLETFLRIRYYGQ